MRLLAVFLALLAPSAFSADKFTGWQSCSTTGCHGGGTTNDQVHTWLKKDIHSRAHGTLLSNRSKQIAASLKIPDASQSAQCTQCHSPMESAPKDRLSKSLKHPNRGVSCEACHGPAENYLISHPRPDFTRAQRTAIGLRDLHSLPRQANACVGCHGTFPPALIAAGHPSDRFELARQLASLPPHWQHFDPSQNAAAWLIGQATLLRELCWHAERAPGNENRITAIHWLLRETELGAKILPDKTHPSPLRIAAVKLAQSATTKHWSTQDTQKQRALILHLAPQITARADFTKAHALTAALRALTPSNGKKTAEALDALDQAVRSPAIFDPQKFAEAIAKLP